MKKENNNKCHSGHRIRIREKINNGGLENMHDHELLEYFLFHTVPYRDTNLLAHKLINHFGSFHAVFNASFDDLMQVEGVTNVTATFISSMPTFFKRYNEDIMHTTKIRDVEDVAKIMKMKFHGANIEKVYMLCLDSNMNLINCYLISDGNSKEVSVENRKIMEIAIRSNAEYVIMVHNHPNNCAKISADDVEATYLVKKMLSGIGIKLVDSIIAAGDNYISLAKNEKYKYMF